MKLTVTNHDVTALNKFLLLCSKKAKKQKIISTYAIPFEFLLVGIIIDGLLKTAPIVTISSLVLSAIWFFAYPKFYRNMLRKHLANTENLESSSVEMEFRYDDKIISFSNGEPHASEKFETASLNRIACTKQNFFLAFERGFHIILPRNEQSEACVNELAKMRNLQIEEVDINPEI